MKSTGFKRSKSTGFKRAFALFAFVMGFSLSAWADDVAQIGETKYDTLTAALGAVENGQTITLLKSADEGVSVTRPASADFTMALGGYGIGNVEVGFGTDSTTSDKLTLTGANGSASLVYVGQDDDTGRTYTLDVSGVVHVSGFYLRQNGTVNVHDATITNDYLQTYGAFNLKDSTYVQDGGINFYVSGRPGKHADGKAMVTLDNSTLVHTNGYDGGIEIGGGCGDGSGLFSLANNSSLTAYHLVLHAKADGVSNPVKVEVSNSQIATYDYTYYSAKYGEITMGSGTEFAIIVGANSSITTGTFTNNGGTIEVDMSGATADRYTLVDARATSDYGTYQFAEGKANGYTLKVVENDLIAEKAPIAFLYKGEEQLGGYGNVAAAVGAFNAADEAGAYRVEIAGGAYTVSGCEIVQFADKSLTIRPRKNGDEFEKVTLKSDAANSILQISGASTYGTMSTEISCIDFDGTALTGHTGMINLESGNTVRYACHTTISNCTFMGSSQNPYAVNANANSQPSDINLVNCTGSGLWSLFNGYLANNAGKGLSVTGCTVTNSGYFVCETSGTGDIVIDRCKAVVSTQGTRAYAVRYGGSGVNASGPSIRITNSEFEGDKEYCLFVCWTTSSTPLSLYVDDYTVEHLTGDTRLYDVLNRQNNGTTSIFNVYRNGELVTTLNGISGSSSECNGYFFKTVAKVVSADGVTTNGYDTLQAAFNRVQEDGVIEVLADNTEAITVTNTCAFTLKANGHSLGGAPSVPKGYEFKRNGDVCTYGAEVPMILVCKESERTANGDDTYTYTDSQGVAQTFKAWAASLAAAVTKAEGAACTFYVGGSGVAKGSKTNPEDAIIVNADVNSNIASIYLDANAEIAVGKVSDCSRVDISRFHGLGFITAYGMVEIDKSAVAADFEGTLGIWGAITSSSSFVSSIEGAANGNLNNNGATLYISGKNFRFGDGKTLSAGETLKTVVDAADFTIAVESQDGGDFKNQVGAVTGTKGELAMLVAVTNYSCYTSPSTPLTTWNGDVTGNIDISLKDARMNRTATFVVNGSSSDYTYESDVKAVVDHSQFYQTQNGGAYKKKGYLTASMWNAGTGAVTQNGNVDYTVKNLAYGSASTTMYALYTVGSGKAVVNGDINLTFANNAASSFSVYGVNDAGSNGPQAELNGNLSMAISDSTMGSFYGAVNGKIDGNFTVAMTNSTVSTLAVLSGTAASITGHSSVLFAGSNTVKSKINGFSDIAFAKDAEMNITPAVAVNFAGTWSNEGSLVVDMTGVAAGRYTLVDNKGSAAMNLAAYGNVTLTNADGFELKVVDNDLVAEKPVARVVSADGTTTNGYVTLQAAFDAVQANETIEVLLDNSETITVTNTCAFTFKSNGYDLSGGSVTPAEGYEFTRVGDVCTYALIKVAQLISEDGTETNRYETLEAAIGAVTTDGATNTIQMLTDYQAPDRIAIAEDKVIVLDLNGKAVTGIVATEDEDTWGYFLINNGILVITDKSENHDGRLYNATTSYTGSYASDSGAVWNCEDGEMVIEEGTLGGGTGGGALLNVGYCVINGGTFTIGSGDRSKWQTAAYTINNYGEMVVNGGEMVGDVRGHFSTGGTLTINNMTIGGAKYYYNFYVWGGSAVVKGGTIVSAPHSKNCYAYGNYIAEGTLTFEGGTYTAGDYAQHSKTFAIAIGSNPVLKGGTYNVDPSADSTATIADGYEVVNNGDGTWTVQKIPDFYQDATDANLWHIRNLAGLKEFRDSVDAGTLYAGKTIQLDADIDLNNEDWNPIGEGATAPIYEFAGTFNGQGHTISNLFIDGKCDKLHKVTAASGKSVGLFAATAYGSVISNLTIRNVTMSNLWQKAGALIGGGGTEDEATISHVDITGLIQIGDAVNYYTSDSAANYVGGIIGKGYSRIDHCSVVGDAGSFIKSSNWYIGGIAGFIGENLGTVLSDCTVSNIHIAGHGMVGGIVGIVHYGNTVANCTVTADVIVENYAADDKSYINRNSMGGIAGITDNGDNGETLYITNNVFAGTLIRNGVTLNAKADCLHNDGIVGVNRSASSAETINQTNATIENNTSSYELTKVAQVAIGEKVTKYPSLVAALNAAKATKGAICTLLADIDLTGTSWTSITGFFGTLNGNGHKIIGLSADLLATAGINEDFDTRPTVISNLTISAANITTTGNGHGFILGVSDPQVAISDVKVIDSSIESTDGQYIGGIVGKGYPEISDCVVSNCTVKGIEQVGGVMGYAAVPQIERCSVVGETTVEAGDRAGGILGKFQCDDDEGDPCFVNDNYVECTVKATGNEDGDKRAGGLIGQIMGDIALYEITGNYINVTFAGDEPTTNPIGLLRSDNGVAFDEVLAQKIVENWWEDVTLDANSFVYHPGSGAADQTIYRMKSPKVTVTMDVNPAFLTATFGGNTGLAIIENGAAAYGYAWNAETKQMTLAQTYRALSDAEKAFLGVFGVKWDATTSYWQVQDANAPFAAEEIRKAADGAKPVLNVTFGVAGTLKAPPSIQDTGCEDLYKTLGACWLMTPVNVSVIGKGDDATIIPPDVSSMYWITAKVAGGAEANFVANGKLFVSNLTFSATDSFTIMADCAPKSGVAAVVDAAEVEIVGCRLGGQLYPYGNFDNRGKLVYNIHHCTFDGTDSSTTYAFFAQSTTGGGRDIGALNFCSNTVAGYPRGISIQNPSMRCRVIGNAITPGTGYSAVQATNLKTLEIAGNDIIFTGANGGNVLTVHESLYNQSLTGVTIDVHDNVISGTGFAIYDDIRKEKGDYDTDGIYTLTWRNNTLADGAAMVLASGVKGAKTYAVSTYVRSVLDPAAFIVRKDAYNQDVTNFYGTLAHALANVQEDETIELLRDNAEQLALTALVPAFHMRANGVNLTGVIEPADGYKFVVDAQAGTCEYVTCFYVAQVGATKYEQIADALAAVADGGTLILLNDWRQVGDTLAVNKNLTILAGAGFSQTSMTFNAACNLGLGAFAFEGPITVNAAGEESRIAVTNCGVASIAVVPAANLKCVTIEDNTLTASAENAIALVGAENVAYAVRTIDVSGNTFDGWNTNATAAAAFRLAYVTGIGDDDFTTEADLEGRALVLARQLLDANTFNNAPANGYRGDICGYKFNTLQPAYVAQVNDTPYLVLADALAAWTDGTTLKLLADATANLTIPTGESRTLDLNGWVLTGSEPVTVSTSAGLTICDSRPTAEHYFTVLSSGLWVRDEANGTALLAGGCITGGDRDVGGGIQNGGVLALAGGNVVGNRARKSYGGIANLNGATSFTMTGGSVTGNIADGAGGGIGFDDGDFALSGGVIAYNAAEYAGGVAYTVTNGFFTMTGGDIVGNTASGVYLEEYYIGNLALAQQANQLYVTNSIGGGGIFNAGTLTISGGMISNNVAEASNGGGIANGKSGVLSITGATEQPDCAWIVDCEALNGGGIANYAVLNITGGRISDCLAHNLGGGIYTRTYGLDNGMTMSGGVIENCSAKGEAGDGVASDGGTVTITGTSEIRLSFVDGFNSGVGVFANGGTLAVRGGKILMTCAVGSGELVHKTTAIKIRHTTTVIDGGEVTVESGNGDAIWAEMYDSAFTLTGDAKVLGDIELKVVSSRNIQISGGSLSGTVTATKDDGTTATGIISGGVFDRDPDADMLVDGSKATQTEDGYEVQAHEVTSNSVAAVISANGVVTNGYDDIGAAFDALQSDTRLMLLNVSNVDVNVDIRYAAALELNGKNLSGKLRCSRTFDVVSGANGGNETVIFRQFTANPYANYGDVHWGTDGKPVTFVADGVSVPNGRLVLGDRANVRINSSQGGYSGIMKLVLDETISQNGTVTNAAQLALTGGLYGGLYGGNTARYRNTATGVEREVPLADFVADGYVLHDNLDWTFSVIPQPVRVLTSANAVSQETVEAGDMTIDDAVAAQVATSVAEEVAGNEAAANFQDTEIEANTLDATTGTAVSRVVQLLQTEAETQVSEGNVAAAKANIATNTNVKSYIDLKLTNTTLRTYAVSSTPKTVCSAVTYDVKPCVKVVVKDGDEEKEITTVLPNDEIVAAITFRLPVPSTFGNTVLVKHDGVDYGIYAVQSESMSDGTTYRYVEIASTSFSSWQVVSGEYVATIGTVGYKTLEAAFAAAEGGDTIALLCDATASGIATNGAVVTLDLCGCTVSGTDTLIYNTSALTVVDSVGGGVLNVTGDGEKYAIRTVAAGDDVAAITISGGTVAGVFTDGANVTVNFSGAKLSRACKCVANGEDVRLITNGSFLALGTDAATPTKPYVAVTHYIDGTATDGYRPVKMNAVMCTFTNKDGDQVRYYASLKDAITACYGTSNTVITLMKSNSEGTITMPTDKEGTFKIVTAGYGFYTTLKVADGYMLVATADPIGYEYKLDAVAWVISADGTTTNECASVRRAVAVAKNFNGGTIRLIKTSTTDTVGISYGQTLTLDLNGYGIIGRSVSGLDAIKAAKAVIVNAGNLTIVDSSGTDAGYVYNEYSSAPASNVIVPAICNYTTGTLTIEGGTFGHTAYNYGEALYNYGTAYVKGGRFTSRSSYGSAVFFNYLGATLDVTGGTIFGTAVDGYFTNVGTLTIGGTFETTGSVRRYAILGNYGSTTSVTGGTFRLVHAVSDFVPSVFIAGLEDTNTAVCAAISVSDGTFTGEDSYDEGFEWRLYNDAYGKPLLTGGTYPTNVNESVAAYHYSHLNGDATWTVRSWQDQYDAIRPYFAADDADITIDKHGVITVTLKNDLGQLVLTNGVPSFSIALNRHAISGLAEGDGQPALVIEAADNVETPTTITLLGPGYVKGGDGNAAATQVTTGASVVMGNASVSLLAGIPSYAFAAVTPTLSGIVVDDAIIYITFTPDFVGAGKAVADIATWGYIGAAQGGITVLTSDTPNGETTAEKTVEFVYAEDGTVTVSIPRTPGKTAEFYRIKMSDK